MQNLLKTTAAIALLAGACGGAAANEAVTFGTNWLAQAEHGGYYQAVADGTYAACGLDVTIMQGGPQVSGRPLLLAGKIQFYMGGNMLQAFDAVKQNIPLRVVAASFQKEPQVLMTHPGQGLDKWEDLKNAEQYIVGDEGFQSFFQLSHPAQNKILGQINKAAFRASRDFMPDLVPEINKLGFRFYQRNVASIAGQNLFFFHSRSSPILF